MRLSTKAMLTAYYYGSLPMRWWANVRRAASGGVPIMVLFYHRVADEYPNLWTMSSAQFERQILWLRERFDLISLTEAQRRIRHGTNRKPCISITFDDGYADNCAFAMPLLIRHRIPCTYFVSMRNVTRGEPFPHDIEAGQPLRPNTAEELRWLANAGIEIGLHTRTHADLGQISDPEQLYDEVVDAGHELANLVDRPIRFFAFPFGLHENLNSTAFQLAQQAGYAGVCSAYGGYNFPGDDPFHLQRFHADIEWIRWKNWVTCDPRKMRVIKRYEYELCGSPTVPEEVVTHAEDDGERRKVNGKGESGNEETRNMK